MEHCIGILIEPLVGLLTMCTEVAAICLDGCLQTCRESCRCIGCDCGVCSSRYHDDEEESRPILQRQQPSAQAPPNAAEAAEERRWSSVGTLRDG